MVQQIFKEKAPLFKIVMLYTLNAFLKEPHITFLNGPEGKGMSQGWVLEVIATDSTYSSPLPQDLKVLQTENKASTQAASANLTDNAPEQPTGMVPKAL